MMIMELMIVATNSTKDTKRPVSNRVVRFLAQIRQRTIQRRRTEKLAVHCLDPQHPFPTIRQDSCPWSVCQDSSNFIQAWPILR